MKKVIAFIAALMVVIRFLVFQCFALPSPTPFTPNITVSSGGNAVSTSILGDILVGAGVSSELIQNSDGSYNKEVVEQMVQEYLNTGKIPDTFKTDDGRELSIGEYMSYLEGKHKQEEFQSWYDYMYNMGWNFYDFVHKNEKNILSTKVDNSTGSGSVLLRYGDLNYENFLSSSSGDYIIVDYDELGRKRAAVYVGDTRITVYSYLDAEFIQLQGDVRYFDGTYDPAKSDIYEYQVGEFPDGTKVTVDMLNPDGTVDGQPVTPDLTKFDDNAILDLIRDILEASKNTYETADPDTTVNPDDIAVPDVAESLENFTVPTGIITVFPFCLPFDFVRGMKTLLQKPKVPVFTAELDLTDFCGYDLGKHEIVISFEDWEPAAVVCRWFFILLFTYTLILITPKICKGAG